VRVCLYTLSFYFFFPREGGVEGDGDVDFLYWVWSGDGWRDVNAGF
jgi:hypothetical protein